MRPKTTQEWKSEMKPITTENTMMRMRMRTPRTRLETINKYLKMQETSQKLRNAKSYA